MEKNLAVIEQLLAASVYRIEGDDGNRAMKLTQAAVNAANALQMLEYLDLRVEKAKEIRDAES